MSDTRIEMMDDPWKHSIKWLTAAHYARIWTQAAFAKVNNRS